MKTTLNIPDDLYRKAKAQAALRGIPVTEMVTEGLRRTLEEPGQEATDRRVSFPLIRSKTRQKLNITGEQIAEHEAGLDARNHG